MRTNSDTHMAVKYGSCQILHCLRKRSAEHAHSLQHTQPSVTSHAMHDHQASQPARVSNQPPQWALPLRIDVHISAA